jgi:PAS domain S-box-containing protein
MKLRLEPHGEGVAPREERTAEVQPHLTEERYRALAETLRAVPWEGEPTTDRVTYVGPQIESLTGYTAEEWMAPGAWVRAMHPDDRHAQAQKYEWHLQHRRDHNLEYRVIAKSGQQIWFRDIIAFVTNADGREIVRGLMIVIDEEKALERALRESEARYSHAERIARLVHWTVALGQDGDWNSHVATFSNTATEILGLPAGNLQLRNSDALEHLIHPEDRDHVRQTMMGAVKRRQSEVSLTYRIVRPDGAVRWVLEHSHNDFDESGRRLSAFGIIQDITEQRERELQLREAYLRAELASRAKTAFLATMSHELRTPLNAIIGFSEVMKAEMMGPLGSPGYKDYAADIHGSGTFLLSIINELLDLSLIDSGEMKLDESLVQVDKIAESSVALLRSKAAAKGVKLAQAASCSPPLLRGDARRIKQAVLNLLTNAIKFTPAGGSVGISASWSDDGMAVTVADTGIGIAAEDLEQVMKPFVQVENWLARKHEGAGLGLAITKSICELHGGSLVLESALGKGTVARILLPADRIENSPRSAS